jgi:hypothetical protein
VRFRAPSIATVVNSNYAYEEIQIFVCTVGDSGGIADKCIVLIAEIYSIANACDYRRCSIL